MTNLRIRPAVASLPRYVPSKTAPDAVKISSNEMPTPPSPAVLEAIARELETINRYPDLTAAPLREALAGRFGVGADQILVLDGGRIVEHGAHADLLAADGVYRRLWNAQDTATAGGLP